MIGDSLRSNRVPRKAVDVWHWFGETYRSRRRHEFRPDGIRDVLGEQRVDLGTILVGQLPAERLVDASRLLRTPCAPKRHRRPLVENPPDREREHRCAVSLIGALRERLNRLGELY